MLKLRNTLFALATGVALFAAASHAHAQIDPVQFSVSPQTPGANEIVHIEAQGVGGFLGTATITWRLNGEVVLNGVGEQIFTFTTRGFGSRDIVDVTINSPTQGVFTRQFAFVPSEVTLVWEADTYTPPFYQGKALYTPGAQLKVVAYPTIIIGGSQATVSSLTFQWTKNGDPAPTASGLGRNVFSFYGDQLKQEEQVGVEVFAGNTKVAQGTITIPASQPLVLLYNRDPLRGVVYEQAFPQAISLVGREITVQAEPYFFSNNHRENGSLTYYWELNGSEVTGPDTSRGILTLRQEGDNGGEAALVMSVRNEHPDALLQYAESIVRIIFGQTSDAQASAFSSAQSAAAALYSRIAQGVQYTPLEPLTSGLTGSKPTDGLFQTYAQIAFNVLIILGGIIAVSMLVLGGVTYMLSEVPGVKLDALDRAKSALIGLLLIGASFLILNTINPQLLRMTNVFGPTVNVTGTAPASGDACGGCSAGNSCVTSSGGSRCYAAAVAADMNRCTALGGTIGTTCRLPSTYNSSTCTTAGGTWGSSGCSCTFAGGSGSCSAIK